VKFLQARSSKNYVLQIYSFIPTASCRVLGENKITSTGERNYLSWQLLKKFSLIFFIICENFRNIFAEH